MFHPKALIGGAILFSLSTMSSFAKTVEHGHAPLVVKQPAVLSQPNTNATLSIAHQVVLPARDEEMATFIIPGRSPIGSAWVGQTAVAIRSGARSEDRIRNEAAQSSGTLHSTFRDVQIGDFFGFGRTIPTTSRAVNVAGNCARNQASGVSQATTMRSKST